ncbi:RHS repeat-associated core domain-containing protein, partial [Pantoea sp. B65]|uniref:RHS repeat-associated core domain-containing protein n=1 Tax=Pantoea sp. B65 TaxID=2813359 RepID=UPI0039B5DFC5
ECYRYGSDGMRISKVSRRQSGNSLQTQRVTYLPGLERHTSHTGETLKAELHTLTAGEAGAAQVRLLHWQSGLPAGISNNSLRYSYDNLTGSSGLEVDAQGELISQEEYYPYGGTAIRTARSQAEAEYKTRRYSGKERDASGLYYYGYRYYQCWAGRWLSADPAGNLAGLNLYIMVINNPVSYRDPDGLMPHRIYPPGEHPDTDQRIYKKLSQWTAMHGAEIIAENLTIIAQQDKEKRVVIENSLKRAKTVLDRALLMAHSHPSATQTLLEPYIGKADVELFSSLVKVWAMTRDVIQTIRNDTVKRSRFSLIRYLHEKSDVIAAAIADEGAVILAESFFSDSPEVRVKNLIHEYSHMETFKDTALGLSVTGPETTDYWYLDDEMTAEHSTDILSQGIMGIKEEEGIFQTDAIRNKIRELTGYPTLTRRQAVRGFNKYLWIRQALGVLNPDTVAGSGMAIYRASAHYFA